MDLFKELGDGRWAMMMRMSWMEMTCHIPEGDNDKMTMFWFVCLVYVSPGAMVRDF